MLKIISLLILLGISELAISRDFLKQNSANRLKVDTLTKYFTENWKEVSDKSQAFYYDRYVFQDSVWYFKEYYKSGKIAAEGGYFKEFKENKFSMQYGKIVSYFEDGNVKSIINRIAGKEIGEQKLFYENGIVKVKMFFDSDGKMKEQTGYYESGEIDMIMHYDSDEKLIDKKYFKADGSESIVEESEFVGGKPAMYQFLQEKIIYPRKARRKNIEGKVFVKFMICDDGTLCDYQVLESPDGLLSEEAVRVISNMPKWKPTTRDGIKIPTYFTLPVLFKLY